MPKQFVETPGERRCVNCDQRLVVESAPQPPSSPPPAQVVNYICPDGHERWLYDSEAREWRQMY